MRATRLWLASVAVAGGLFAQAAVEYSLGTAGASGTAAAGKGISKSLSSILGGLNKNAETKQKSGGSPSSALSRNQARWRQVASVPAKATVAHEPARAIAASLVDPAQIEPGMTRRELIEKFGNPSMRVSSLERTGAVDSFWYGDTVRVTLLNGRVTDVYPPPVPRRSHARLQPAAP